MTATLPRPAEDDVLGEPEKWHTRWARAGLVVAIAVALLFSIVPLVWMVSTSLKTNREITQDGTLLPHSFTLANYSSLFKGREFGSYLTNSILVTVVSVAVALLLGTHAAYAIARFRLWGGLERYLGFALLVTRILPPIVVIIPVFLLAQRLSLLNTRLALIIVYSAFNVSVVVWMMESFFREIPVDLEEAAMVDGDSRFAAFRRIVLPLAAPGLVATGIFTAIVTYNEFLFALVLTSTPTAETMPSARRPSSGGSTSTGGR
jgi:multiple sugar transport system permease protein